MQNKPIRVEMIGVNNNGTINSISSNSISPYSKFINAKITISDLFSMPENNHNTNLIYGFSHKLNKNIFIYPISSRTIEGTSLPEYPNNYIYSQDDGESWMIGKICDENGNIFDYEFDSMCYANGLFYAFPTDNTYNSNYLTSYDGIIWELKTCPNVMEHYNRIRWVTSLNNNTILALIDSGFGATSIFYSQDNGTSFTKISDLSGALDRILITDNDIYIYSEYNGDGNVYVATNNGTTNLSFNLVNDLHGTINMAYGHIKYQDSNGNIVEGYRTIALTMTTNNRFVIYVIGNNGSILRTFFPYIFEAPNKTSIPRSSFNIINNLVFLGVSGQFAQNENAPRGQIDGILVFDLSYLEGEIESFAYPKIKLYNNYGAWTYILNNSDYNRLITIKDLVTDGIEVVSEIFAFSAYIDDPLQDIQFNQKDIYIGVDSDNNRELYQSTTISKNNFYKANNQSYQGMLIDITSSENANTNGYYDYDSTLFIYGEGIQRLLIFFDKDNNVYPTKMIINGIEYSNTSDVFYVDFSYPKYDNLVIQFTELNKPNAQLRIGGVSTDVNCVFNRGNGLNSVTFTSVDESVPYYGVVSYSGSLEINDREGILKSLSDFGLLPNIQINVYINNIKVKTFTANNDISYSDKEALVSIELLDEIQFLQQINTGIDLYYKDLNAVSLFNSLAAKFPYQITLTSSANSKLLKINISQIFIEKNTWWEVWNSFCSGTKTLLYKDINDIYRVGD